MYYWFNHLSFDYARSLKKLLFVIDKLGSYSKYWNNLSQDNTSFIQVFKWLIKSHASSFLNLLQTLYFVCSYIRTPKPLVEGSFRRIRTSFSLFLQSALLYLSSSASLEIVGFFESRLKKSMLGGLGGLSVFSFSCLLSVCPFIRDCFSELPSANASSLVSLS